MAGTSSISGLASGLDTVALVNQLMSIESLTQNREKTRKASDQSWLTGLQALNSKVASLLTSVRSFRQPTDWNLFAATSSSDKVKVTAGIDSLPGEYTFTVDSVATAHKATFISTASLSDVVTEGSNQVTLDYLDGTTKTIDTGDGTLRGLIAGLNASGTGVRATTIRQDDGSLRLSVTSTKTGLESDFALTNADGSDLLGGAVEIVGQDAQITVGQDTLTSSTNTFKGVLGGLDVTLLSGVKLGEPITITAEPDAAAAKTRVRDMVKSMNDILAEFDKLAEKSKSSGGGRGVNVPLRQARDTIIASIYDAGAPLADIGIQTTKEGKIVFDEKVFDAAYADDPVAVTAKFYTDPAAPASPGYAERLAAVLKDITDPIDGSLTGLISGRQRSVDDLTRSIANWDDRLTARRIALERQFAALESALGGLNSMGSFLAGQINQLPSFSTTN